MAIVKTNNQYYTDIADAIRARNGKTLNYKPSQLAPALYSIFDGDYQSTIRVATTHGSTVTGSCDGVTRTDVADGNGIATLTNCGPGAWSIESVLGTIDGSSSIYIDANDQYVLYTTGIPFTLSYLTIYANAYCKVNCIYDGSIIFTESGRTVVIDRLYPGSWTIECIYSDQVKTLTLTVGEGYNEYVERISFDIYTISVQTEPGATVYISKSAEDTRSTTANSSGYAYFYNCAEGTWSVSADLGLGTGSGTVIVDSDLDVTFYVSAPITFPEVSTVKITGFNAYSKLAIIDDNGKTIWGGKASSIGTSKVVWTFYWVSVGTCNVWYYDASNNGYYWGTFHIPYDYSGTLYEVTL